MDRSLTKPGEEGGDRFSQPAAPPGRGLGESWTLRARLTAAPLQFLLVPPCQLVLALDSRLQEAKEQERNARSTEATPRTPFLDPQRLLLVCLGPQRGGHPCGRGPAVTVASSALPCWHEDHTQRPVSLLDKHSHMANFFSIHFFDCRVSCSV